MKNKDECIFTNLYIIIIYSTFYKIVLYNGLQGRCVERHSTMDYGEICREALYNGLWGRCVGVRWNVRKIVYQHFLNVFKILFIYLIL